MTWPLLQAIVHSFMDQPQLSDAIASNFLGHPSCMFTIPASNRIEQSKLVDSLAYRDPGVKLAFPPEWHGIAGGAEGQAWGINLTIPFLNGTWQEKYIGPRFPPRGNYSQAFIQVRSPAYLRVPSAWRALAVWLLQLIPLLSFPAAAPGGRERAAGVGHRGLPAARLCALPE